MKNRKRAAPLSTGRKQALEQFFAEGAETQGGAGPTPMDDVFRTECVYYPEWVLPVLKEIFQDLDIEVPPHVPTASVGPSGDMAPVSPDLVVSSGNMASTSSKTLSGERGRPILLGNKHPALTQDGAGSESISKRESDCVLEIKGKLYHLECQSTEDGQILIRMVEYGTRIALEHAYYDSGGERLILELPRSALLYLRGGIKKERGGRVLKEKSDRLTKKRVCLKVQGRKLEFDIPVLNVQAFSLEEIFEKRLYMLLPFYFLRFEKDLKEREGLNDTIRKMEQLAARIALEQQAGKLSEQKAIHISAVARLIIRHVMRFYAAKDRERMERTMGGRVLKLYFDFDQEEALRAMEEKDATIEKQEEELKSSKIELEKKNAMLAKQEELITELNRKIAEMVRKMEDAGL